MEFRIGFIRNGGMKHCSLVRMLFNKSGSSISFHPWRTSFCLDKIQYNQKSTLVMGNVGCILHKVALLVGCLGDLVLKVDIDGAVKKKGQLQVLDYKWYLEGPFVFQVLAHCRYIVELDPIHHWITMLISLQLYTYCGKSWMSCISDRTHRRLPGRLISEG